MQYNVKKYLSWQKIQERVYIVDERSGQLYELNEIAGYIWNDILTQRCLGEIVEKIVSDYIVNKDEVIKDVEELIADFAEKGFIEIIEE